MAFLPSNTPIDSATSSQPGGNFLSHPSDLGRLPQKYSLEGLGNNSGRSFQSLIRVKLKYKWKREESGGFASRSFQRFANNFHNNRLLTPTGIEAFTHGNPSPLLERNFSYRMSPVFRATLWPNQW